jgi:hypothetical protein
MKPEHRLHTDTARLARDALATLLLLASLVLSAPSHGQANVAQWNPSSPGLAYGFLGGVTRVAGSASELQDYTVAAQLTARNDRGVHQWAFGVAAEAWALPGSRSTLVGVESAVINEEPSNMDMKVASNSVFKNRADGAPDPGEPMNVRSIAYWVTAQPGTGFERGLVFGRGSLAATTQRPAVIDVSDLTDAEIAQVDLIRIRRDVVLRYDPATRGLVLVVDAP